MPKNPHKEKIQNLEQELKDCRSTVAKYQNALISSHQRIQKISKELNLRLSLVRELHKSLFPTQPIIPGFSINAKFQPAHQGRSGDFFNVIKLDKMHFGILLAHFESYTTSALFLSSFLQIQQPPLHTKSEHTAQHLRKSHKSKRVQQTTAEYSSTPEGKRAFPAYKRQSAKNFVSLIHKKIGPALKKNETLPIFWGLVSLRSFTMDCCLAGDIFVGHKSQGKPFKTLIKSTPGLKRQGPLSIKEARVVIHPKDTFLFCSPGVIHRTNNKGQSFGVKNIVRSAQQSTPGALEIRQNVLFASNEFGANQPTQQDMTVIVAQAGQRILRLSQKPSSKAV